MKKLVLFMMVLLTLSICTACSTTTTEEYEKTEDKSPGGMDGR